MSGAHRLRITCDDLGYHPTFNEATVEILSRGVVRSASIMAPAPYFDDAVRDLRAAGVRAAGVHLTLSSEFPQLPVLPLSPRARIASLIEADGRFPRDVERRDQWVPEQVEIELRAQIERVRATGLRLTHLDGHMFCYEAALAGPRVFAVVESLAREYGLPLRRRDSDGGTTPAVHMLWTQVQDVAGRCAYYAHFLETFRGPPTELIIHPGKNLEAMQRFSAAGPRRLADYVFFTSDTFQRLATQRAVELIA